MNVIRLYALLGATLLTGCLAEAADGEGELDDESSMDDGEDVATEESALIGGCALSVNKPYLYKGGNADKVAGGPHVMCDHGGMTLRMRGCLQVLSGDKWWNVECDTADEYFPKGSDKSFSMQVTTACPKSTRKFRERGRVTNLKTGEVATGTSPGRWLGCGGA